ncbi:SpoIIE family protein phosphatase [Streptomyces sp. NBC_01230]|uniref:SpoIIE family protein phosphatase n=1 Tax=unclassified Streptomyces TaxID=2593676 RepID=UPI002E114089|nr:SpoIIE family protein phosphatase [Streptomyces sp. NBC_01230]
MSIRPTPDCVQFRDLVARTCTAAFTLDADGKVATWSQDAEKLLGYSAEDIVGGPAISLLAEESDRADLTSRVAKGVGRSGATTLRHQDGSPVDAWLRLDRVPLSDETAHVWLVTMADVESAKYADMGSALLEAMFGSSKIGLIVYDSDLRVAFANTTLQRWPHLSNAQLTGRPPGEVVSGVQGQAYERGLRYVLRTGRSIISAQWSNVDPAGAIYGNTWTDSIFRLEDRSENPIGVADVMFDTSESARSRGRLALMSRAIKRIGASLDVEQTVAEFCDMLVPQMADFIAVDLLEPPGQELKAYAIEPNTPMRRMAVRSVQELLTAEIPPEGAVLWPPESPQIDAIYEERPVVIRKLSESSEWYATDPVWVSELLDIGVHSAMAVPIRTHEVVIGVATLLRWRKPISFETDDARLVEELSCRAALSIDNARRYDTKNHIALTLQRRLLPQCITMHSAVEVAYRYLPADDSVGIGGDWFDVIPLPKDRVALVVGDVTGHGIHAAAAMGRLRATICTLAALDMPPDDLLFHADRVTRQLGEGADDVEDPAAVSETCSWGTIGATCLYIVYDPASQRCTIACAGHPAPVIIYPDGDVEVPQLSASPPLGMNLLGLSSPSAEMELQPGTSLVLFSDGLIERRDRDIEAGMDILRRCLRHAEASPDHLCDLVLRTMVGAGGPVADDVTVLIARIRAIPGSR